MGGLGLLGERGGQALQTLVEVVAVGIEGEIEAFSGLLLGGRGSDVSMPERALEFGIFGVLA